MQLSNAILAGRSFLSWRNVVYKIMLNNLETHAGWEVETGADINPIIPSSFTFEQAPDGILVITNTGAADAAGLLAFKVPFPALPTANMPYFGVDLEAMVPDDSLPLLRCLEVDLKAAQASAPAGGTLANVADGSGQYNLANGFWQIDTPAPNPVWENTPYEPTPLIADVWTPVSTRYNFDWSAGKFSVLSAKVGSDNPPAFPASLGDNPLLVTNWAACLAFQLQTCLMVAGTVKTYYRNIHLTISDTPF